MAYVVKVLILYVQHQGFAAIGVDENSWRLSRCYKTLILCRSKLWMKMVHCQDSDYDCRNRILPGVIVLISLVARHKEKSYSLKGSAFATMSRTSTTLSRKGSLTMTFRCNAGVFSLSLMLWISFISPVSLSIRKRPSSSPNMNTSTLTN